MTFIAPWQKVLGLTFYGGRKMVFEALNPHFSSYSINKTSGKQHPLVLCHCRVSTGDRITTWGFPGKSLSASELLTRISIAILHAYLRVISWFFIAESTWSPASVNSFYSRKSYDNGCYVPEGVLPSKLLNSVIQPLFGRKIFNLATMFLQWESSD